MVRMNWSRAMPKAWLMLMSGCPPAVPLPLLWDSEPRMSTRETMALWSSSITWPWSMASSMVSRMSSEEGKELWWG